VKSKFQAGTEEQRHRGAKGNENNFVLMCLLLYEPVYKGVFN